MELHILSAKLFGFTLHRHVLRHLRDHFIPHAENSHLPHVLHHRVLGLYSILLILMKLAVLSSPLLVPYSVTQSIALTTENVIALTNQSRTDYHLPQLISSAKLAVAAANKARNMMQEGYFAHFSPEGISPWYWISESGYNYSYAGENLAISFSSAEGVNEAWLASPTHRANILSADFKEIGVAVLTDKFGQEGTATIVVQMFGSQAAPGEDREPAPSPSQQSIASVPTAPAKVTASQPIAAAAQDGRVAIDFPLQNSYVNTGHFDILGTAGKLQKVRIVLDGRGVGLVVADFDGKFSFRIASDSALSEGAHTITTRLVDGVGEANRKFLVDFTAPTINPDGFSILPSLDSGTYDVKAQVSVDSVRTIVTIGQDSTALAGREGEEWIGQLKLLHPLAGESVAIEIIAQDMAGNESRLRVGELVPGQVKGVYSFVSGDASAAQPSHSFLGGLINVRDLGGFLHNFYLLFAVSLGSSLALKLAIARHLSHIRAIVGASGVMMLAMLLFIF